jgi:hypothetical protein
MFSEDHAYNGGDAYSNGQGTVAGDPRNTEPFYMRYLGKIQPGAF